MYHGPFPFAREAFPLALSLRQSWKYFPPAGPRCAFFGLHRVGGYRGNEIFCSPYNANESFFMSAFFGISGAAKGLPRASTCPCARVCVSFPECPGTPRVKRFQIGPLFPMGGKVKQKPHFFHPKIGGVLRGRRATRRFFPGRTREFLGAPSLFK